MAPTTRRSQASGSSGGGPWVDREAAARKQRGQQLLQTLTLRLSYAKLKIDNNWIKLSLDEVENMYFRAKHREQAEEREEERRKEKEEAAARHEDGDSDADGAGSEMEIDLDDYLRRPSSSEEDEDELESVGGGEDFGEAGQARRQPSAVVLGKRKAVENSSTSTRPPFSRSTDILKPSSNFANDIQVFDPPTNRSSYRTRKRSNVRPSSSRSQGPDEATAVTDYASFWKHRGGENSAASGVAPSSSSLPTRPPTVLRTSSGFSNNPGSSPAAITPSYVDSSPPRSRSRTSDQRSLTSSSSSTMISLPSSSQTLLVPIASGSTTSASTARRGRALGAEASFSSLPPIPPLPFLLPSSTPGVRREDSTAELSSRSLNHDMDYAGSSDSDFPGASQEQFEEVNLQTLDDAFSHFA